MGTAAARRALSGIGANPQPVVEINPGSGAPLRDIYGLTYSIGYGTGIIAAGIANGSEIHQFRWTSAVRLAAIWQVAISAGNTATAFTAGTTRAELFIARAWTVAGTGGVAATLTGDNQKLRTEIGTTALGEVRNANTAALGAGTKTLDSQAIAGLYGSVTAVAGDVVFPYTVLFSAEAGTGPIILAENEGLVLKVSVPATGTWNAEVNVKWSEVSDY